MRFKSIVKLSVCALTPLLIYGSYLMIFGERPAESRLGLLSYNFENSARSADAAVSIINAFGFVWLLAIAGMFKLKRQSRTAPQEFCFWGVILLLPLNSLVVAFFTLIRETRLLFVPFLFVIPVALWSGKSMWESMKSQRSDYPGSIALILGAIMFVVGGVLLAEVIWPVFDYQSSSELRRTLAGINIGLTCGVSLFWVLSKTGKTKQVPTRT